MGNSEFSFKDLDQVYSNGIDLDMFRELLTKLQELTSKFPTAGDVKGEAQKSKRESFSVTNRTCNVCGKPLHRLTDKKYCSMKCRVKHFADYLKRKFHYREDHLSHQTKEIIEKTKECVQIAKNIREYYNKIEPMFRNPEAVVSHLKESKEFSIAHEIITTEIQVQIIRLRIAMNNLIIEKSKNLKFSFFEKAFKINTTNFIGFMNTMDEWYKKADEAIEAAESALDSYYAQANKALTSIPNSFINAQTMNFLITPKSFLKLGPKVINKIPSNEGMGSTSTSPLIMEKVDKFIETTFPKMTQKDREELSPTMYKIKEAGSLAAVSAVRKGVDAALLLLNKPEDPLPVYAWLNPINIRFNLWSVKEFGPKGAKHFGLPV